MPTHRTPIALVKSQFCAAAEQLAMGPLAMSAVDGETPRDRALRIATEWLTGLPEPRDLPYELSLEVDATRYALACLREAGFIPKHVALFVCSVLGTAILAAQYEAIEAIEQVAEYQRRRKVP